VSERQGFADRVQAEFGAMTRGGRIIIILGGGLLLLIIWSELLAPIASGWSEAADSIAAQVDRVDRAESAATSQRSNVIAFGPLTPPSQRAPESQAMLEAVNTIMAEYDIRDYEFNEASSAVSVGGSALRGIDRIKATLEFEAEHEKAIEILGALEDSPALEAISNARVQVGKSARSLSVQVTIEAWIRGGRR
jgi:hypothetical protein